MPYSVLFLCSYELMACTQICLWRSSPPSPVSFSLIHLLKSYTFPFQMLWHLLAEAGCCVFAQVWIFQSYFFLCFPSHPRLLLWCHSHPSLVSSHFLSIDIQWYNKCFHFQLSAAAALSLHSIPFRRCPSLLLIQGPGINLCIAYVLSHTLLPAHFFHFHFSFARTLSSSISLFPLHLKCFFVELLFVCIW